MSVSNNNGRALEAKLVDVLCQRNSNISLLGTTAQDQQRDLTYFSALAQLQQQLFTDFSVKYAGELSVENIKTIERLKDSAAVAGDVTDIRIGYGNNIFKNISLKHNHDACKHQRPAALIKNQLGIQNPNLDKQYRAELKAIENRFKALVLPTDVDEEGNFVFRAVKARVPNSIPDLYRDVCNLVKKYLTNYTTPASIQRYFKFLVGNNDFEKVTLDPNSRLILIKDFSNIENATSITNIFINPQNGYLVVQFDNNFILNMRLHTASSKFKLTSSLSLKFDSTVDMNNAPIPLKTIPF
ncbi:HaeIII family restriction endonuclease [Acinetobacter sp. dk771]|uniref:HaeIII family restriction endonuclease n=1 Tax=Acinetobacter wanghuae TaxID=2662362 RepID=A0AA90W5G7_9GAMM|nr:HaeIII family restriction endonuclease [Acinetobacter wanghuae]MQW93365.1 HaeIII family restriction endonuclease [Acinetobacter wanghuae]